MSDALAFNTGGVLPRDHVRTLFGQTMGLVAVTAGLFAVGAYAGRDLSYKLGIVWFILAIGCLFGMRATTRRSGTASIVLLFVFGLLMGLAVSPTIVYYAQADPTALWQAGGATALFIAGFGAAGYATRRDLTALARICFWALLALIVFGIVLIFVHIPQAQLLYSILGLLIFAGLTMFDFQRLRRSKDVATAPMMAASIFLDALNVFLFFLQIFGRNA
jgi:uncharacterized protein